MCSETGRGVLVIADRRLRALFFGQLVLLATLPLTHRLSGEAELVFAANTWACCKPVAA
jgi:hypothetical protein